jgi:hypothetical protein
MDIWFETTKYSQARVLELCDFVARHVPASCKVELLIGKKDPNAVGGDVQFGFTGKAQTRFHKPGVVEIFVWVENSGSRTSYPFESNYVEGITHVVRNWEEEFVMVLSHELRHVAHFTTMYGQLDSNAQEVDAEKCAQRVLALFRKTKIRRSSKTRADSLHI